MPGVFALGGWIGRLTALTARSVPRVLTPTRLGTAVVSSKATTSIFGRFIPWFKKAASGKLGAVSWVFREIFISAVIYSGVEYIGGLLAEDDEQVTGQTIRNLFLPKPVMLALEGTAGVGDPESIAIVLDNLSITFLSDAGEGDIRTVLGMNIAIAADYIRKTAGGTTMYAPEDALYQITNFGAKELLGLETSGLTNDDLASFSEMMRDEYSGTVIERVTDLLAYQCNQLNEILKS